MIKIFRNIRRKLLKEKRIGRYLLYAIGEILLVVIGILIALSVNNKNNANINRRTEIKVYENLKAQLHEDRLVLQGVIDYNLMYWDEYKIANQIIDRNDRERMDTLGKIIPDIFKYSDFNRTGTVFQNLINSGDIKLMKNRTIVDGLQNLEVLYIYINRLEENHFKVILEYGGQSLISSMDFSTGKIEKPDKIYNYEFQNLLIIFMMLSEEKAEIYKEALYEIDAISAAIEKEL